MFLEYIYQILQEMKKIQPEGPYRIVGYSYGACIGFEIATQMQDTDGVGSIEKLILLDGSHLYMQTYRNVRYKRHINITFSNRNKICWI